MARIFISYRRDDTAGYAGRLFDELVERFGRESLVMDIDSIPPGENFVEFIRTFVGSCDVMLVLIGRRWLTVRSARRRRLDDPDDFVRLEVATALSRGIRVIPVLFQDAVMPPVNRLPEDLQALSRLQAVQISDQRWDFDVRRVIRAIEGQIGPAQHPLTRRARANLSALVLALGLGVAVTFWIVWDFARSPVAPTDERGATPDRPELTVAAIESPSPPRVVAALPASTPEPTASVAVTPSPAAVGLVASPEVVGLISSPSPVAGASSPTCAAAFTDDGSLLFNPDEPIFETKRNWTSAGLAAHWMIRSVGCPIAETTLSPYLVPAHMDDQVGLYDQSWGGVARVLRGFGLPVNNKAGVTFDEVSAIAGRQAVALVGGRWMHAVGVRRVNADGELVLANSVGSASRGAGQEALNRQEFEALGPFSAMWIDGPTRLRPTPMPTATMARAF